MTLSAIDLHRAEKCQLCCSKVFESTLALKGSMLVVAGQGASAFPISRLKQNSLSNHLNCR